MNWKDSEKRVARHAFDAALQRELAAVMAEFKQRAAAAKEPDDLWNTETYLTRKRKDIDAKYDYRYSQLVMVFAKLMRDGFVTEQELEGLAEDKARSYTAVWSTRARGLNPCTVHNSTTCEYFHQTSSVLNFLGL
jgi:Photoprotection regulator fluorescence recovery protein